MLEAITARIPEPSGDPDAPLRALIFDSWYDPYLGVAALVRIQNGRLAKGQKIRMMATGKAYQVDRVGVFTPVRTEIDALGLIWRRW